MHLFDANRRFYGGNAIVGGGLPIAVGLALAEKMQTSDRVACCFFGEGAVAEGEFHESYESGGPLEVARSALSAKITCMPWVRRWTRSESVTDISRKASAYAITGRGGRWHGRAGGRCCCGTAAAAG